MWVAEMDALTSIKKRTSFQVLEHFYCLETWCLLHLPSSFCSLFSDFSKRIWFKCQLYTRIYCYVWEDCFFLFIGIVQMTKISELFSKYLLTKCWFFLSLVLFIEQYLWVWWWAAGNRGAMLVVFWHKGGGLSFLVLPCQIHTNWVA